MSMSDETVVIVERVCVCVECGSAAGELQDVLTCGDCLEEFALSDIVRFIRHKVSHGHGARRCTTSSPPVSADDDDATPIDDPATAVERRGSAADELLRHRSPSRRLVCDSSLPGDDGPGPASDTRLNGDADDCFHHRSACTGQLTIEHCTMITFHLLCA